MRECGREIEGTTSAKHWADRPVLRDLAWFLVLPHRLKHHLAAKLDAAERAAIAKAFNDRYTYRKPLIEGAPILPGTFYGAPHRSGYAWMCPECNRSHHPVSDSVFSGLQYPACCSRLAGHRLEEGIRTE